MAADRVDVPLQLSRTELIRLHFYALAELVAVAPCLTVPLGDFSEWVALLGVDEVTLRLGHDGRVQASVCEPFGSVGYLVVTAVADVARDVELPPTESGKSVRLPVGELSRLEMFEQPAQQEVA